MYPFIQEYHLYKNSHINKSGWDVKYCCTRWKSLRLETVLSESSEATKPVVKEAIVCLYVYV